jgi:hypothetical protein
MGNGHDVTADQAKRMLTNYRVAHGKVVGFKFERARILDILNQAGCTHLRIYYGYDTAGADVKDTQIIVGVDGSNNDMSTDNPALMAEYGQESVDQSSTLMP